MNKKTLSLVQGALIAAMYAALFYAQNLIFPGTATMAVQFRVAELLCILALWTPSAIWGLALGTMIANISSIGVGLPLDMIFGTVATILAAACIWKFRNVRVKGLPLLSLSMPAIFNGIIVGLEIEIFFFEGKFVFADFLKRLAVTGGCVALGEIVVVLIAGSAVAVLFEKKHIVEKLKLA